MTNLLSVLISTYISFAIEKKYKYSVPSGTNEGEIFGFYSISWTLIINHERECRRQKQ